MTSGWIVGGRVVQFIAAFLFAAANLVPLYGISAWGWDAFQLLILYWSETVIIFAWALVRIGLLPTALLGDIIINGKSVKATHPMMVGFFAFHAGLFISVHLLFLCVLFSGDWFHRVTGFGDFLKTFYVTSGAWIALLVAAVAGAIEVLIAVRHPQVAPQAVAAPAGSKTTLKAGNTEIVMGGKGDAVGSIVGALYGRIVTMQIAIIFGAWMADRWGSLAPLVIMVVIKTIADFFLRVPRWRQPQASPG